MIMKLNSVIVINCIMCIISLHQGQSQISFYPTENVETLPKFGMLTTVHFIQFGLLPDTLKPDDFLATWTLPNEEMVSVNSQSANQNLFVRQGLVPEAQDVFLNGTTLQIYGLSFMNAGVYRCSVQDLNDRGSPPTETQIELQLLASLTAIKPNVVTLDNASSVELRCEMGDYVRPDNRMQWFKDGQMIVSGQNRRTTIVINGENRAANGALELSLSRISILTIIDPIFSDSGTYECRVIDEKTVQVELQVLSSDVTSDTTTLGQPAAATTSSVEATSGTRETTTTSELVPVVAGSIGTVLVIGLGLASALSTAICCVAQKRKANSADEAEHDYENPDLELPPSRPRSTIMNDHIPTLSNEAYEMATIPAVNPVAMATNLAYGVHIQNNVQQTVPDYYESI